MKTSIFSGAVAAGLAFAGLASAADTEDWKTRSIYQVMIDRFARTDGLDTECKDLQQFCGGSWKGLLNKLDYIQGMGFDALQISPITKNTDDNTSIGVAYHGYWPDDLYSLNDRYGTEQDLKDLIAELHKRDMYVMLDVVVNHMAQGFDNIIPPKVDYSKFKPFDDEKYFHPYCNVTMWENTTDFQECWLYPNGIALADLATEKKEVSDEMNKWIKELVSKYDIDGLRIDAAKHVNDEFLPSFVNASGVFALGEVLSGEPDDMCRYQSLNLLPGMPNYLHYFQLKNAMNSGSFVQLGDIRKKGADACTDVHALGTFMENHDMPRFASLNPDLAIAKNVMSYVILSDGIPTVYQGQEQHFNGAGDPDNRETLWTSKYDQEAPLYKLTTTLNKVRTNAIKLSHDYVTKMGETLWADNNHFCLKKGPNGSQVVFCLNNKSSLGDSYQISVGGFEAGDKVVEVLRCRTNTADVSGNITMYMGNGEPKVWVPLAVLKDTNLCPETKEDDPVEPIKKKNGGAVLQATSVLFAAVLGSAAFLLA
ncbi:hypothetical protein N0V88_007178 [Collariella sp. IMI 366227]|nr:hypothetical protein N0V88_007178 [Collariella sp. IMI 366227]